MSSFKPLFSIDEWKLPSSVSGGSLSSKPKKNKKKKTKSKGKAQQPAKTPTTELGNNIPDIKPIDTGKIAEDERVSKNNESVTSSKRKRGQAKNREQQQLPAPPESASKKIKQDDNEQDKEPKEKLTSLQQKMREKLIGSRFRWINEQLYTMNSDKAFELIKETPDMYEDYHLGFRSQVQSWPENPVDNFVKQIKERYKIRPLNNPDRLPADRDGTSVIADMGCGDAKLAADLQSFTKGKKNSNNKGPFIVHSFDLAKDDANKDFVTVADIKNVPLADSSVNVVIFCLSLMGTNFIQFIQEAKRILKPRGELWIAEIKSRLQDTDGDAFVQQLRKLGLYHRSTDSSNTMFITFEFFKPIHDKAASSSNPNDSHSDYGRANKRTFKPKFIDNNEQQIPSDSSKLLKPCLYKKR